MVIYLVFGPKSRCSVILNIALTIGSGIAKINI